MEPKPAIDTDGVCLEEEDERPSYGFANPPPIARAPAKPEPSPAGGSRAGAELRRRRAARGGATEAERAAVDAIGHVEKTGRGAASIALDFLANPTEKGAELLSEFRKRR